VLPSNSSKKHSLRPHTLLAGLRYRLYGWLGPREKAPPSKLIKNIAQRDDDFKQLSFTFAVIALSARLACADGPLTQEKYIAFRSSFPLKGGICGKIRSLFMLACDNPTPFEHYVTQIKYSFPGRSELFLSLLDRLFSIAAADGTVSREEERMLSQIAHQLDISAADYSSVHARHIRPPAAHEVLGVSRRAKPGILKKRYRELIQRYHPDRYAGDNLSPEVELMLKLKTSEINKAYRTLSRRAA
jgi:DnaJ like chaperone protein